MALLQRVQFGLSGGLDVHEPGVGTGKHPQDLVEFALHRCLLTALGVLQREHHNQRTAAASASKAVSHRLALRASTATSRNPALTAAATAAAAPLADTLFRMWSHLLSRG